MGEDHVHQSRSRRYVLDDKNKEKARTRRLSGRLPTEGGISRYYFE